MTDQYAAIALQDRVGQGGLSVFDLLSGKTVFHLEVWVLELALSNHAVFFRDIDRHLYAYDIVSGQLLWDMPAPSARGDRGLFAQEEFLYSVYGLTLQQFQAANGQLLQTTPLALDDPQAAWPAFAWVDKSQAAVYSGKRLSYYSLLEARHVWVHDALNLQEALWPPVTTPDAIFFLDDTSSLIRLSAKDGQLIWETTKPENTVAIAAPAKWNENIHVMYSDGSIRGYNSLTGLETGVLLKTSAVRYWGNIPTVWVHDFIPGLATTDFGLVASFGCESLYAITPSN